MRKDDPYYQEGMWKGAPSENFGRAKSLRSNLTEAENKLWKELKKPPFTQFRFRRQHPVQNFIVDFYSHSLRLVIEVDGKYHENPKQIDLDKERSKILKFNGLDLIRFSNEEILNRTNQVLQNIQEKIHNLKRNRNL